MDAHYPNGKADLQELKNLINDKVILITGGSGALGNALIRRLLELNPKEIRIFSRAEKLQEMTREKYSDPRCNYILGDVRDYFSVRNAIRGSNIVIHAAAFKYLDLAEVQVAECIKNNVYGSINVINALQDEKTVDICLGISTDKASSPINVYGMSKLMMERLFCEAERTKHDIKTRFLTVRYGNVLMTTGSVVPRWKKAYEKKEPIKVTDPAMTRFMFTLDDSIDLIFYALLYGRGGDIISVKMPSVLLGDLARVISRGEVPVTVIGRRAGEKTHECLIADSECQDTIDVGNNFVIRPHSGVGLSDNRGVKSPFTSQEAYRLTDMEIKSLLGKVGAL